MSVQVKEPTNYCEETLKLGTVDAENYTSSMKRILDPIYVVLSFLFQNQFDTTDNHHYQLQRFFPHPFLAQLSFKELKVAYMVGPFYQFIFTTILYSGLGRGIVNSFTQVTIQGWFFPNPHLSLYCIVEMCPNEVMDRCFSEQQGSSSY